MKRPIRVIPQVLESNDKIYRIDLGGNVIQEFARMDGNVVFVLAAGRTFKLTYDSKRVKNPLRIYQNTVQRAIPYDYDGHCLYYADYAYLAETWLCGVTYGGALPAIPTMGKGVIAITQRSFSKVHLPPELIGDDFDALVYSDYNQAWVRVSSSMLQLFGEGTRFTKYSPAGNILDTSMWEPTDGTAKDYTTEEFIGQYL